MATKQKTNNPLLEALIEVGSFDIGWQKFPFIFKKGIVSANELECLGAVDFDLLEIQIDSTLKPSVLQHTMSHECWHVMISTLGIRVNDEDVDKDLTVTNEFITEQMARGITMFKRLNPDLWILLYENKYE